MSRFAHSLSRALSDPSSLSTLSRSDRRSLFWSRMRRTDADVCSTSGRESPTAAPRKAVSIVSRTLAHRAKNASCASAAHARHLSYEVHTPRAIRVGVGVSACAFACVRVCVYTCASATSRMSQVLMSTLPATHPPPLRASSIIRTYTHTDAHK